MVDKKYIEAVKAHNEDYPNRKIDIEYALTHRGYVMNELIKDLQSILGTDPDGTLGKDDKIAYEEQVNFHFQKGTSYEILPTIRRAMWCKGYHGGDVYDEEYGDSIFTKGLNNLIKDAGLEDIQEFNNDTINFKLLKAIFSLDAYVVIESKGLPIIREMQQNMNKYTYKYIGIFPCDGVPQSKLIKQIVLYMQIVSNDPSDFDGEFGDKTLNNFLNNLKKNSNSFQYIESVKILKCLLCINKLPLLLTGDLNEATYKRIREFKTIANLGDPTQLNKNNDINKELVAGLLRSCGLKSRKTFCCDTSYIINQNNIKYLISEGYSIIGRYISGTVSNRSKALTMEEIDLLLENDFEIFLIFQEGASNTLEYFKDASAGIRDGNKINKNMKLLNIPENNVVFVAIDCDMYENEFIKYIVPYMEKINQTVKNYRIGVYCSRLGCQILKEKQLASAFFISGASFGFCGNYGVTFPDLWHFEQFKTDLKIGNLLIDKVAISLNYSDVIANFDSKEKKDYTDIIMEKLNEMEEIINERYSEDEKAEFYATIVGMMTDNELVVPAVKLTNIAKEVKWFFEQVTHRGPWDLKVDDSWKNTLGISPMPRFGIRGGNEYFFFYGYYINREELGNITYGYLGKAMNFPDVVLYIAGGMASKGKKVHEMLLNSLIHIADFKPPNYGDSPEDHDFVEKGVNLYKKLH